MRFVALLVGMLVGGPVYADPSLDGRLMWSAFQCATFAGSAELEAEFSEYFELGFEAGHRFIGEVISDEAPEDFTIDTPVGVLMLLQGPNPDFAIGRIFAAAERDALDEFPAELFDNENRNLTAKALMQDANCSLLLGLN